MECKKDVGHTVFPIFYHVDPSHDKIPRWRTALTEAANLSGWHLLDGYESNQIKEITNSIFHRLNCKKLDVGANLVGIDSHVKEMILRLHMESSDVRIVGICGVGGIGKTTIAKVIYNKLSCKFECISFLENIREIFNSQGLSHLQNQLLGDILEGEGSQNINCVAHRASMIKDILLSKRVFIVLDDVEDQNQLEYLLGHHEWLGEGSRVIITTRNKHVLAVQEVDDLYEVEGLNFEEACELFSLYAFKQNLPKSDYRNLSCRVVGYCQGLPLALKVLGSLLFKKIIPQWKSELHKFGKEPEPKIHNVLKRSYDGLDCEDRDFVSRILDGCDFHAEIGIKNLNDECLITLPYNQIHMHDLVQQMGWKIVCEKFPNESNKWSRLWDPHDIECALTTYENIEKEEDMSMFMLYIIHSKLNYFGPPMLKVHSAHDYEDNEEEEAAHDYEDFEDRFDWYYNSLMENASKMYLCWDGYPLDSLPSNFDGENLVELHLNLKVIDLSFSKKLVQMPEFSSLSNLERLILKGCVSLIDIHPSVGGLKKLTTLNLRWCHKLKGLRSSISNLESLKFLDLSKCSSFAKFSEIQGNMRCLQEPYLKETATNDLPTSIGNSRSFWDLDPCGHSNLVKFPGIQGNMRKSVEILDLSNCSKFEKFPENGANMKSLWKLDLTNTAIKELPFLFKKTAIKDLPDSMGDLESLPTLDFSKCSKFEKFLVIQGNMRSLKKLLLNNTAIKGLPDSIGYLKSLEILNVSNCSKFENFPKKGGKMKSLKQLLLKNTAIKDLPDSMGDLESLEILDLFNCSKFENFPEKGGNMKSLKELSLHNTAIKDLPDSMGNLESLEFLDLSNCSKFEKFPEKGGNMKSLRKLCLTNTAIKDLPNTIGSLQSLVSLDLSNCSKFEKFSEKGGNMKSLRKLCLTNTAIKDLPNSIGSLQSLVSLDLSNCSNLRKLCLTNTAIKDLPNTIGSLQSLVSLDLSNCSKFEKFSEKGGNMKSLRKLCLTNSAIKDLPNTIGSLQSLVSLDLSNCSKYEKFPEKGGNMKSLRKLCLTNSAIKDLPNTIGSLQSLVSLDLSNCSKFEKFSEKGGNMKSLRKLCLTNTAIKDLPNTIGSLQSLVSLDLSNCSKFEKFPEKGGNMKSLRKPCLTNTAIKDLPNTIGSLQSLVSLDLSNCSKFEKFPELKRRMIDLCTLNLRRTPIEELPSSINKLSGLQDLDIAECKSLRSLPDNISRLKNLKRLILGGCSDLWEGLISNQLCNLGKLNTSQWKMAGQILEFPSSLNKIDAHHSTSKEALSSLLWLCHLSWLKSAIEGLKCWKLSAVIPESSGIPEWMRYQNLGRKVTMELPTNWYEDPDFLGFVVSCVYQPIPIYDHVYEHFSSSFICELNLRRNGFGLNEEHRISCHCECHGNFNDMVSQVWVCFAIHSHILMLHLRMTLGHIKKCCMNLIFAGDQQNYMPMLVHPRNSGDNGSVVLEDTDGNRKRRCDDSRNWEYPTLISHFELHQ
ncbi:hypothetical protein PVL29_019527 [Vitis rotundifolia]|uniref:ADP-ribosyl cyclase/cyclic ADP-ribose hydrolase n=1 Tax=Vitis rotundifolia TaxID=103349 RepID=A0AA39DFG3_VITRO|nr:hypothetical protein PVL29_019527 [Vitis rotundifolia]